MSRYLISNNLSYLENLNDDFQNYMIGSVDKYNAKKWGVITKHKDENNYALDLGSETEVEEISSIISNSDKLKLVKKLPNGWIKPQIGK